VNNGLDAVESGIYMLEDAMFLLRLWRRVLPHLFINYR
jgi:hypothetical protein